MSEQTACSPDLRLLKAKDVAALFRMHVTTVYDYAAKGIFPSVRMGNAIRFRESDLLKVIEQKVQS